MIIDENYPGIPRSVGNIFAYHLPDNENRELQINGLAMKEQMKPCLNIRKQGNSDYLILYFYDPIQFQLRDSENKIVKNKWIILTPGTPHAYGNLQENWSHSWIHLSGSFLEDIIIGQKLPLNCLIDMIDPQIFETLLIRLHEEIYFNPNPQRQILSNELQSTFIRLSRSFELSVKQAVVEGPIGEIKQMLDYGYSRPHNLKSLSEKSGFSIPYLCVKFSQLYQCPPIEYLIRRRISISRSFLEKTDWSIGEVCIKVGYDDLFYFSKLFKKRVGMSPSTYRKRVHDHFFSDR